MVFSLRQVGLLVLTAVVLEERYGCAEISVRPPDWRSKFSQYIYDTYQNTSSSSDDTNGLFQGDIELAPGWQDSPSQPAGKLSTENFWKKTSRTVEVPYKFGENFDEEEKQVVETAMHDVSGRTSSCIRFREKLPSDVDYLEFRLQAKGGSSQVGRQGGRQLLKLSQGAIFEGIGSIQHELLHALGMWHEQARPDRDLYVTIDETNIKPRRMTNFDRLDEMETYGEPYDYDTLMHYRWNDFALDTKKPTIIPKSRNIMKTNMGQRISPTKLDIAKLRAAYDCPPLFYPDSSELPSVYTFATSKVPVKQPDPLPTTRSCTGTACKTKKIQVPPCDEVCDRPDDQKNECCRAHKHRDEHGRGQGICKERRMTCEVPE